MTDQQKILAVAALAFAAFFFYKKWKMRGNKVKLKEMLTNGAKIIDVRSPGEFAGGHFSGAINIPLDQLNAKVGSLGDKSQPIIVCCASGMRSSSALGTLKAAGFTNVENGVNTMTLQTLQ